MRKTHGKKWFAALMTLAMCFCFTACVDGNTELYVEPNAISFGGIEITIPEGFKNTREGIGCTLKNDKLSFKTWEHDLDGLNETFGESFESMDEFEKMQKEWISEESEAYQVCGKDCIIEKVEDEGDYFYMTTVVLGDLAYEFDAMAADAYNIDGEKKPDCYKLTDEDYAAFKEFLDGIKLVE